MRSVPTPAPTPVNLGLFVAALVLWAFEGFTWWVLLPLLVGSLVVRLLVPLFFEPWRNWAGPAVLAAVVVWLMTMTSVRATLVAFGTVLLGLAWGLRLASPKWVRWVALGLGVAMVLGGGLAEFVVWANGRAEQARVAQLEHEREVAELRPDTGGAAMHDLIQAVAEDDPRWPCERLFTPAAAEQFAEVVGTTDCAAAIHRLNRQITSRRDYANARVPREDSSGPDEQGVARVSGCNIYVTTNGPPPLAEPAPPPGPALGQLRLEKDPRFPDGGYLITGYTRCGVLPPGVTPTRPVPPPILPGYPPAFAALLAEAAAERDVEVCGYFTDRGQAQLAAAFDVADCAAAVQALAEEVTDAQLYRRPADATAGPGPDGAVWVDACQLTWFRVGARPGDPPPGPQLGHLTLTPGPRQGYLVDGYRPC